MWSVRVFSLVMTLTVIAASCGDDAGSDASDGSIATAPAADPYDGYESEVYADVTAWLCRPDQGDVCDSDLDATVVAADGSIEVVPQDEAPDAAADCFYVYPTASMDPVEYSDLEPGPGEEVAARNQAARFSSVCRVFAPMYGQLTVSGLAPVQAGGEGTGALEQAFAPGYEDVLDAWKHYISNDNDGRPVVLLGHSQGASNLKRLVAEEIDGRPDLQDRLLSALILGWPVAVPDGEVVGGDFSDVPVCTEDGQVGCVVSYSTFRATEPPSLPTDFAWVEGPERAACTNPAALDGEAAVLTPYFQTTEAGPAPFPFDTTPAEPFSPDAADAPEITTPWVTYPDLLSGACVRDGDFDYLAVTIDADPADPRTDDIGGDLEFPGFGLHMVDYNAAMGDLVGLVESQIAASTGD